MKKHIPIAVLGLFLVAGQAFAQRRTITGTVTSEQGTPLSGVAVVVKGATIRASTNNQGTYSVAAETGQVLQFRLIGTGLVERTVGAEDVIDVQLRRVALDLNAVEVTALGEEASRRSLGIAQQTVRGAEIAQTQRENFINALSGRVAGVDVTSTSGVPGASTSIVIRGVSSISSSNQPLIIVDGLPMDNKTVNTTQLASDRSSNTALSNRGVDFTNRAADLNPQDIETVTILKGAEAAALYGIDAGNGAIVIKTKRGRAGGGMHYSNSVRLQTTRARPQLQRLYGPSSVTGGTLGSFQYFGAPYAPGTQFFDNIDGFLRTSVTQKHNLAFSGATSDATLTYRLSTSIDKEEGVVRNSGYDRINVTGASTARINDWLSTDLSMIYTYANNDQVYKGDLGPLIGLMLWPQTDNAKDYLTPAGTRRRLTALTAAGEVDNPYFNVAKNQINSKTNRLMANIGLIISPFSWGNIKTNIGTDTYTNQNLLLRHPESYVGFTPNGLLDVADVITRNISSQTILNVYSRPITRSLSISGLVGNHVNAFRSNTDAATGIGFLDPNFVSMNNTSQRSTWNTLEERRRVSLFGQAVLDYKNFWYVTVTGRNDWTSTIPRPHNSFFYPSVRTSFVFSDAFPGVRRFVTGLIRLGYAKVGKDAARPYADRPSLEYKTTSHGGYGYGFTGPNPALRPEFKRSVEGGVELSFFDGRLALDATAYRATTTAQIVNDIRGSYGTGFILFNLNGASTRSRGLELTVRGSPVLKPAFSWDVELNWNSAGSIVTGLPNVPESYVSDTWLYGNVRNGVKVGLSTMALTGWFYLRNNLGDLLIDPVTGLPIRSNVVSANFIDAGYDRQPDFTIGVWNSFKYKKFSLDFLLDIRKGGDVFNATEHYLTTRGLSMRTLDRDQPRVIQGVLRDGLENTANPTVNNIVIVPSVQTAYYTNMSEELFIERDINWLRLRDITLRYELPSGWLGARNASAYITGTDLFLITNYSGLDPIVNGNTAAVGGSGAVGIDYGNFPMPRGINFGVSMGF